MNGKKSDALIIGAALFAMFFGSGNLIFPPYIGVTCGSRWLLGFISYFIADGGLALLTVFAMAKAGGDLGKITGTIGRAPSVILNTISMLCIGPFLAIPRNGAVTFEVGVQSVAGSVQLGQLARIIFSVVFFTVVLLLTLKPSSVLDIVGKILTPLLSATLLIMIFAGILDPKRGAHFVQNSSIIRDGIYNGYQTLDMLAALFFSMIAIRAIESKGYKSDLLKRKIISASGLVSGLGLAVIYGGLTFLGATTGSLWEHGVRDARISQAQLLINITQSLLGRPGAILIGIVITLACITTAIGLTSATASYFEELSNKKLPYRAVVIAVCVLSAILCNLGLDLIISAAFPILSLLYPVITFLIVTSFFESRIKNRLPFILGTLVAFAISLLNTAEDLFAIRSLSFVHLLPLSSVSLEWLPPAAIVFVIAALVSGRKGKR